MNNNIFYSTNIIRTKKRNKKIMQQFITKILSNQKLMEFFRWACVGFVATLIHYGIYYVLKEFVSPQTELWLNIDYTIGYVVSFFGNFFLSAYFTFHEKPSLKKGFGFGIAHAVNYGLHILFLNLFFIIIALISLSSASHLIATLSILAYSLSI